MANTVEYDMPYPNRHILVFLVFFGSPCILLAYPKILSESVLLYSKYKISQIDRLDQNPNAQLIK